MEEDLERLVMQKMMQIELGYPRYLRKYGLPDNDMYRLAYYALASQLFLAKYMSGEFDDFEARMMEELGKLVLMYTTKIQADLRKDLDL